MSSLEELDRAYKAQLLEIRAAHGSAWTVFTDSKVEAVFPAFEPAAEFAFSTLGDEDYLIRHTFEEPDFAPFIVVGRR